MRLLRRLLGFDEPQEIRFFLYVGAFGVVIGIVYWFLSYEVAGTVLLIGFGAANGIVGARLAAAPVAGLVRHRAGDPGRRADAGPGAADVTGGGTAGIDRPFLDESGRLPSPTLAPFAVGLGVAAAATGAIFGPALLVVGLLPFAWGAWTWLHRASAELDAVQDAPATPARPPAPAPPAGDAAPAER